MDCSGRGEEGSDVPRILADASTRAETVVLWLFLVLLTHPPAANEPRAAFVESLYSLSKHKEHLKLNRGVL